MFLLWGHWRPYSELLVMSVLDFKARMEHSVVCMIATDV